MIKSKADYKRYKECDKKALLGKHGGGIIEFLKNDIWRFEQLLQKDEYLRNCRKKCH